MYSGQHRTSKNSSDSSSEAAPSQFAPPRFVVQPQAKTDLSQAQNTTLEPLEKAEEVANEAVEVQRLSESGANGDEDANSGNGGTIQRAFSEYDAEKSPFQTKLTIGAPGDKYEQEADSMAEKVMSIDTLTATNSPTIQSDSEAGFDSIEQKPLVGHIHPLIQRQIELNIPRQPITSISPLIQRQIESNQNRTQTNPIPSTNPFIQRFIHRAGGNIPSQKNTNLESRLASQKGSGSPLDEQTRSFMEPRFGNDFSSVRVHTDSSSVQMNQELGAQAFTHGQDVYFGAGKYNPGVDDGKRLLAHELTHVVQQTGAVQPKSNPHQAFKQNKIQTKALFTSSPEAQSVIQSKKQGSQESTKQNRQEPIKQEQPQPQQKPPVADVEAGKEQPQASATGELTGQGDRTATTDAETSENVNTLEQTGDRTTTTNAETIDNVNTLEQTGDRTATDAETTENVNTLEQTGDRTTTTNAETTDNVNTLEQTGDRTEATDSETTENVNTLEQTGDRTETTDAETTENVNTSEQTGDRSSEINSDIKIKDIKNAQPESNLNGVPEKTVAETPSTNVPAAVPEADLVQPTAPTGAGVEASSTVGMVGEQQSAPSAQAAAPISADEADQIIEQLKNTPPTEAVATYEQAQIASAQALENQTQQVQSTLPEIPAPTGLSPQESAEPTTAPQSETPQPISAEPLSGENAAEKLHEEATTEPQSLSAEAPASPPPQTPPEGEGSEQNISQVKTSAGKRPTVELSGETDPSQMDQTQAESKYQVQEVKTQASQGIKHNFGENNIFPQASQQILKANKQFSSAKLSSEKLGKAPSVPPEVVGGLNQGLTPFYQEKIAPEQEKYKIGKNKFDVDSGNTRSDADQQIATLNEEAKQKQLAEQRQAKQEVGQARLNWQTELDNVDKDYQEKAGNATKEQQQKINEEKAKAEAEADQHLIEAEQEAEAEKQKAEAEKQKAEEEANKPKSFWEKVGDFFSSIWEGIKKAFEAIFNALREVVKAIFEAVKTLVNAVIDLARQVITGLIKALGEIIKAIVQVALAAFPEISKKFTDMIDQTVNKAVEAVNAAADFLKNTISTVLDFLAKTLDTLLGLVQDLVKGIFTVIGMIITGQIGELIERFGNLIEGAKAMPDQFETAGLEELMGGDVDLDKPLAPEEIAQAQQAGVSIPGREGEGTAQAGEVSEMPQAPWNEDNVGVDSVENNMELSPEISDELMQKTNGEGEVLLAESNEESRSMDAIMSEATSGKQAGGEKQEQQIPDDGLTPKQRASIKWDLMKEGIKQWFSDNWPKLLAGLIAATVVIIAAIVASGGAVLAALPMIMQVLGIVFAADAIAKIGGYLRDYLSKSWEGDIQGGGKSLAKALAAGAIELAMLLTFGAGKAATKGVKAVAKGTAKVVRKVSRAVIKGVKYVIKKGKVFFKGIAGTGVGKQFKRLGELGQGLLNKMRFKGFRIRVKNRRFRLEGLVNPWVLIAEGKINTEFKDAHGNTQTIDKTTPKATFITDDELKAVKKGGTPKTGDITEYEVVPYKTATTSGKGARGKVKDDLTGDHVPSRAALVKAKETKLGRKLTAAEKTKIRDEGVTVVLKDKTHKELSRTYGGSNQPPQIAGDANDLGKAFREDAKAIFEGLSSGKNFKGQNVGPGGELNPEIVGAYMRAYRENVMKRVFAHSDEADKMFMDYLKKVTSPSSGSSSSGVGSKRPSPSSTSSSSKKPRT
ncbi:eCIS core domain-containing protein [Anabaena sp. CCY 0017]|uniref:eCIS core domain-containing protein n=1 Tax=Anabaena sp. CCY 0017 TaxID=3103866 RepID=UPI0039C676CD